MFSPMISRLPEVEGVRPELAAAIMEMLAICPRAEDGICGVQLSLSLRLGATHEEVRQALRTMETAGVIEQVHDAGLIAMWCLP